ncbi:MAG TPA: hypothetical protein IAD39_02995 [Candidatus Merdisoma faecalis]|nr:hypothetical protein [Candidatus Merdisoma faecalis]
MNYMVMECHPSYAVLLDEEGRFLKAANLHYKTGQIVHDPVLMKEEPAKQRNLMRWARSGMAAAAACFLLLIGFNYYQNNVVSYSSIYLTINPEIQMDLNRKGSVTRLEGINEDGKTLLEGYDGKGKDKITVTDELIDRAIEMGFLSEGGQISFSIDAPDDALIQKYGEELQTEVLKYLENQFTITVEITNYQTGETESTQSTQPAPETVAPETVAPAADDTDYGPNNDGVTDYNDTDYGPNNDGVTDYNDTDYGPNNDGVTDYDDTDYGPNNDGVTDYDDTDYGPNNDGVTDYTAPAESVPEAPASDSSNYGDSNYDDGGSSYSDSDDDDSDDNDGDDDDDDDD